MRTSITQNVLYDYRQLNLKEEVRCSLENAFHLRKDFTRIEDEEKFTIGERLLILVGIAGGMTCLYFLATYIG